ncbi:MAG: hypothetical protein MZV63_47665 [Marinilabiliales bacterium]|nr:hypothetical protein [Marinilabiliales bacterium]
MTAEATRFTPYAFEIGPAQRSGSSSAWVRRRSERRVYENGRQMIHLIRKERRSTSGLPRRAGPHYNIGRVSNKSTWNLVINENDTYLYNYELSTSSK